MLTWPFLIGAVWIAISVGFVLGAAWRALFEDDAR